ncbi:MAG: FAD-binding protein, partial [Dehalococcoidia bacterium]|nr:FAD-binding protein [Dehalococcoidia bacterium]
RVALTKEAAHSTARILHAGGDATGEQIEISLSRVARMSRIKIFEHCLVSDILVDGGTARGVKALDSRTGQVAEYEGSFVVLATGGAGQLFKYNTNPDIATGDGIALAFRAGADIIDMEFFQFHPTALRLPGVAPFLISEAVRGEGGILRNVAGRAFMADYSPQKELAPRDVVARSVVAEMKKTGADHVLLDVTHLPGHIVAARFPTIYRFCLEHGLDITAAPIPVAPAAHYMMGGVRTNVWGETSIANLFACGETACTGVHGANRLASNSLLEVLVFSKRIIQRTETGSQAPSFGGSSKVEQFPLREWPRVNRTPSLSMRSLQALMWDNVSIVRSKDSLEKAAATLAAWGEGLSNGADRSSYELANMVLAGRLMAEAALAREESRGAHYRCDFPEPSPQWLKHIVFRR